MDITIDTREQTPFHFDGATVRRGTLTTGDYAITGDKGFAVERKSFDDFLGTISTGWERFQREIARAKKQGYVLPIIVEGSISDCLWHEDTHEILPPLSALNHPLLSSAFILSRIGEIWQLGGCVIPCEDVQTATAITYALLTERNKALNNEHR